MNIEKIILYSDNNETIDCNCQIEKANDVFSICATILQTARVKEAVLFSGEHGFGLNLPFYGDGYQKLTQYRGTVGSFDTFAGFTDKDHYKMPQTDGYKTVYNYALIGSGKNTVLIGASSCNRFRTEIRVNGKKMQIVQCLENIQFNAGEEIKLEDMVILTGERNEILDKFAEIISKNHPVKKYRFNRCRKL